MYAKQRNCECPQEIMADMTEVMGTAKAFAGDQDTNNL